MGEVVAALTMLLDIHCVIINTHSKRSKTCENLSLLSSLRWTV